MFDDIVQDILENLHDSSRDDVMKECVDTRLKMSLKLYQEEIEQSCEELLNKNYVKIVKGIIKKYKNSEE